MPSDLEATIDQLRELLPYVARNAERFRSTAELVEKSRELHLAARALDETLPHPSLAHGRPVLRVHIGSKAVEALQFRKLPYDLLDASYTTAEPGKHYDLRFRRRVGTDTFNPSRWQPVYGQVCYFDLATLGRTLEEGGELSLSE